MWNRLALAALATLCLVAIAKAQSTGLAFERENIRIESPAPAAQESDKPSGKSTPLPHPPLTFDVEVRPENALRLEYIHTLNELADNNGVIIAFTTPSTFSLPALKVPTPVDTLFVSDNGTIVQILPNTVLADLTQEITTRKPIKAFLFLKAGTAKAQGIRPHDLVRGSTFAAAPPVLE